METNSSLPSVTAMRRFIRDTARSVQNDFTTANESLDDFLACDPQMSPKEAGESVQIAIRKAEKSKERLTNLIGFIQKLKTAEMTKSQETLEQVNAAFAQLKASLESPDSTGGMLS